MVQSPVSFHVQPSPMVMTALFSTGALPVRFAAILILPVKQLPFVSVISRVEMLSTMISPFISCPSAVNSTCAPLEPADPQPRLPLLPHASTPEYKEAYRTEMENAHDFPAAFAIESNTTKATIGYQMYVHQDVTGRSLIADTRKDVDYLKKEIKQANQVGASYGMSQASIDGMKAAMRDKVSLQEKAITAMEGARAEYEKYKKQAGAGNARAKRRGGMWM